MSLGGNSGYISSFSVTNVSHSGRRVFVPVRPAHAAYTQYRHISGIPATSGQRTVPPSRLYILNNLIEKLQQVKKNPYNPIKRNASSTDTNMLIKQYADELHKVMKSATESFGTLGGATGTGIVFSITA